jgi:hypothetical protein
VNEVGRASTVVSEGLASAELEAEMVGPRTWMTVLSGQWKRTLPVMLRVEERSLYVSALLCGEPDERHAEVYGYLLRRNQRPSPIRFALDDDGDVVMIGWVPLVALDATSFDRLLGEILTTADEVFNAVLRRGFAGYIEAEQRWRAAQGLPPNPVSEA